ncbi:hypothetical protein Taro_004906 [Colocasia esculenta]|uniref:Uncharacterized protein n=1 Tax=Colocasia esculenta TaxID=4460 RepID=A0A843TT00_COLES|nr:hypothetical protein [Colocasia esculenta]
MSDLFFSPSSSSKFCLPRRGAAPTCLLSTNDIVIMMVLAAGCGVASAASRKGGKLFVFSLFNMKSKIKFWI